MPAVVDMQSLFDEHQPEYLLVLEFLKDVRRGAIVASPWTDARNIMASTTLQFVSLFLFWVEEGSPDVAWQFVVYDSTQRSGRAAVEHARHHLTLDPVAPTVGQTHRLRELIPKVPDGEFTVALLIVLDEDGRETALAFHHRNLSYPEGVSALLNGLGSFRCFIHPSHQEEP